MRRARPHHPTWRGGTARSGWSDRRRTHARAPGSSPSPPGRRPRRPAAVARFRAAIRLHGVAAGRGARGGLRPAHRRRWAVADASASPLHRVRRRARGRRGGLLTARAGANVGAVWRTRRGRRRRARRGTRAGGRVAAAREPRPAAAGRRDRRPGVPAAQRHVLGREWRQRGTAQCSPGDARARESPALPWAEPRRGSRAGHRPGPACTGDPAR